MGIVITIVIFILWFIFNTLFVYPRPRKDIITSTYSYGEDIWKKREGNTNLIIMFHGMYSSPNVFEEFADQAVTLGWDVYMPVLPDSAQTVEELFLLGPFLWEESLQVAFQKLIVNTDGYSNIVLGGHSQGGSIALTLAPSLPFLKGLVIVGAPINLWSRGFSLSKNLGIVISGLLHFFTPKKGIFLKEKNVEEKAKIETQYSQNNFIFGLTLHSMNLGLRGTRKHLSQIKQPVFFSYETGDRVVPFDQLEYLKKNIGSAIIKEKIFSTLYSEEPYSSRHRLFNYIPVKDQLNKAILAFLQEL